MVAVRRVMQQVILVDVGELDSRATLPEPTTAAAPGSPDRRRPTRSRHPRRWWLTAAASALVLVVGVSTVADRRESVRLAALAGVPGVLAPVDPPVTELWRANVSLWPGLTEDAGRLVGVEGGADGSVDVVALDLGTGAVAWRAQARGPGEQDVATRCAMPAPPAADQGAATAPVVVCVVVDGARIEHTAMGSAYYPTRTRVVAVDASTGEVLHDGAAEPSTSVAAIGADLVTSRIDADGRLHVTRTDARQAATRWTFTSPQPLPLNTFRRRDATVSVVGDVIVVDGGAGWALSGAGTVLHTWGPHPVTGAGEQVQVLRGGHLLVEPAAAAGDARSQVVDLGSGRSFTAAGSPVVASPDDGSLADLILMQSAPHELTAYDLASGRARWTTRGSAGGGLVIMAGRILRGEGDELQSIDGRTGRTVWASPVAKAAQSPLVSDGRLVLITRPDAGRGIVLDAYGLDDGRLRWESDVDDDLYSLVAYDGRLFGWGDRLVALGRES